MAKLPSLTAFTTGSMSTQSLPAGSITDARLVDELFDNAFSLSPQSEFLSSIYDFWQAKAFLTPAQFKALQKFQGHASEKELDFD
jgi:hypothetical protein